MIQEDAGGFPSNQVLDLRIGAQTFVSIDRRACLVDQLIQPRNAGIPFPDPATGFGVVERMQDGIGVECRVVPPAADEAIRRFTFSLEELIPGRSWIPDLEVRSQADLREHLGNGFVHLTGPRRSRSPCAG